MKIEQKVIDKIVARQKLGVKKYGVSISDEQLKDERWLIHLQEELLDGAIYIEKLLAIRNK